MRLCRALMPLVLLLCGPVSAQTQLSPEEFMDHAAGRTLTFESLGTGRLVGIEEFLSRQRTVWARSDGSCTYGEVTLTDSQVCFRYEDQWGVNHCWTPYEVDGTIIVVSPGGSRQRVSRITDQPVACYDPPMS
ncbi:hypothetical protein BOO69_05865 [Sulfitobacter alexandrii]|uniref:Dihydrodipicolinate reductase n=1 Tax=Sulfitobacter alexandrii TaxID=1917485 RepID=A0A1J0WFU1_9RHOB|nr:hypothetical protein [Sulfitobacter alexandrii]APE42998.1 hypothetical protein BOO69_05865 [Sulfitobacter alexandrii]